MLHLELNLIIHHIHLKFILNIQLQKLCIYNYKGDKKCIQNKLKKI